MLKIIHKLRQQALNGLAGNRIPQIQAIAVSPPSGITKLHNNETSTLVKSLLPLPVTTLRAELLPKTISSNSEQSINSENLHASGCSEKLTADFVEGNDTVDLENKPKDFPGLPNIETIKEVLEILEKLIPLIEPSIEKE